MSKNEKIDGSIENWESRKLGADEKFAVASRGANWQEALEEPLGLQMISIRMQKKLLEEIKMIAEINDVGYQPLIKQVLQRFVDAEMKNLLRQRACEARSENIEGESENDDVFGCEELEARTA